MAVRLTRKQKVISTTYGSFLAIERHGHCPEHSGLPPARSPELRRIVAPGSNHAFDVIAAVGSCEEKSRVLLVCMDSLSGQVLDSRKIGSENNEQVKGVLKDMRRQGYPRDTCGSPSPPSRRSKVKPRLRTLVRSLKKFATSEDTGDLMVASVVGGQSTKKLRSYCTPEAIKGAVHALAWWEMP